MHHRYAAQLPRLPAWLFLCLCLCLAACQPAAATATPPPPTFTPPRRTAAPATATARPATVTPARTQTPAGSPAGAVTAAVTPSITPSLAATLPPWEESEIIGYSVQDRPLTVTRLGRGARWFVVLGAIHGGHECSTADLADYLLGRIRAAPEWLPEDVTLFLLPLVNPDGCAANTRHNARDVDLNRNWDTPDWTSDVYGPFGAEPGSGGSAPFSEPETQALRDWLLDLQTAAAGPVTIIAYHAAVPPNGVVLPGYRAETGINPQAAAAASLYAELAGYDYATNWVGGYPITGEFIHWADRHGLIAIDVELPDRNGIDYVPAGGFATHGEINLQALLSTLVLFRAG